MPVTDQLAVWPVVSIPNTALLLAAALAVKRLPTWHFYAIFGVLFVGGISTYYFLLPLLHMSLLAHDSLRAGARSLVLRIFCPWIGGFLLGQLVMLAIVYFSTLLVLGNGQIGLNIPDWRAPSPAVTYDALIENAGHAAASFLEHLRIYTSHHPAVAFVAFAGLALVLSGPMRDIPSKALACAVVLSLYCSIILFAVAVNVRMGIASAIGATALLFLPSSSRRAVYAVQIALLCGFIVLWGATNINTIFWRVGVTEAYRTDLQRIAPLSPAAYEGVIIVDPSDTIRAATRKIESERGLPWYPLAHPLERPGVGNGMRWPAVATAAGFRRARICEEWLDDLLCHDAKRLTASNGDAQDGENLYRALGTVGGGSWLVLRLN